MIDRFRFASVLLIATLIAVASYSVLTPKAYAAITVTWDSRQDNGATLHLGTITVITPPPKTLPSTSGAGGTIPITYNPAAGYVFVRWETTGGCSVADPNAQSTSLTITNDGTVTAVYRSASVGGIVLPTNTLTVLAPYLAVIGLVATAAVAVKKRRN